MHPFRKLYKKEFYRAVFLHKIGKLKTRINSRCPPRKARKSYATSAALYTTARRNPAFKFCELAYGPIISLKR